MDGLSQGIAQGLQTVEQGMLRAEDVKNRRQHLNMQAKNQQIQQGMMQTQSNMQEMQMQMLQARLAAMEKSQAQETFFNSFDAFKQTGNASFLNEAAKNPLLSKLVKDQGWVSFTSINDLSEDARTRLGYSEDKYLTPVVATKQDGSMQVVDIGATALMFGYGKRDKTNLLEELDLKIKTADAKAKAAEATLKQTEADSAIQWLQQNEGATYADYISYTKTAEAGVKGKKDQLEFDIKQEETLISDYVLGNQKEAISMFEASGADEKIKIGDKEVPILKVAKQAQGDAVWKDKQIVMNVAKTYNNFRDIKPLVEDPKIEWGAPDKIIAEAERYLGEDNFIKKALSYLNIGDDAKAREEMRKGLEKMSPGLARIGLDTRVMTALAAYIKDMSGAAVTNEEREFYKKLATGGTWATKEAFLSSVENFMGGLQSSYKNSLEGAKDMYPYDYMQMKNDLNTGMPIGQIARNPKTGESVKWNGLKWVEVK